jgi:hypothetical protein
MPTLAEFAEQLSRCAQSPMEVRAFVEAFSRVRLRYIARQLSTSATVPAASGTREGRRTPADPAVPNWSDATGLEASGLTAEQVTASLDPNGEWLHVVVAMDNAPASKARVAAFLGETCLSDKQRRALFPGLSSVNFSAQVLQERRRTEVPKLNQWLSWARSEGIRPTLFGDYQRHLRIHGASQNAGGDVGAVGGAIAILDALVEISEGREFQMLGSLPSPNQRDPLSVDSFLRQHGIGPDSGERPLKCILLANSRAIMFASDPDVAIIQSLREPFRSPEEAWEVYSTVRSNSQLRAQRVHEFAVGETKTATDASNLHERMALSTRETRSERQADRFLMMAILTGDLLTGAAGESGRRNTRAPMQSREMGRVADVFNLHHAWGWDGGRERHPEHWMWFKKRLRDWTGL